MEEAPSIVNIYNVSVMGSGALVITLLYRYI